jgi:hypothetical protein
MATRAPLAARLGFCRMGDARQAFDGIKHISLLSISVIGVSHERSIGRSCPPRSGPEYGMRTAAYRGV